MRLARVTALISTVIVACLGWVPASLADDINASLRHIASWSARATFCSVCRISAQNGDPS